MIGEKLADRYEILGELGRGGMGVVYKARDPKLNREVAVKLIPPSLLTPESRRRFEAEAQVVARLDHPAIVSIHDFGQHEESLFFVMPVVEGENLRKLIREKSLLLGEILDAGIGVAEALEYSHSRGVVHRDIKPENIMVTRPGDGTLRVRVMDFGLARTSEVENITKTGVLVGTTSYLSPEQASGRPVDARSDIYSLATLLYECVGGEVPFSGDLQAVLYRVVHEIPQPLRERGAEVDEELDEIILSGLAKDPAERPQKASELSQALRRYRSNLRESARNKTVMVTRVMQAPRAAASPFVGRKDESRELQLRLNTALAGECQFVVVSGDVGVGKTRLLSEIEKIAQARSIRVLHGRFMEQDSFPYHGFCEAIQEYFRQKESGSSLSSQPDLSDLGAELISLFPMLSEIDPIRSGAGDDARVTPAGESPLPENRTQIFEVLARTLIRLAGGEPLVLILEDLHGAEASIEALRYIIRRLGPTTTLIIGTFRSPEVHRGHPLHDMLDGFQGDRNFSHIQLRPFTASDHRQLLSTLMGGAEVSDDLASRFFESTEGNPFFTKELVRSLMDAGGIVREQTGVWSLSGATEISSDALPATIQQAVEKRVARLPDELRTVLSTAAVIGKTFDFKDLEALSGDATDLDDAVDRLTREGLVEEERQSRGDTLTFSSGVVREVLYLELSRRKRRGLHRKYAAQIEKRNSGKLERIYPQLVHHYSEGDVPDKTVEYGLKNATRTLSAFSPEEAVRSVKTALEFLDEEWEGDPAAQGDARMLLASAYQMSGDVDGALREMSAAIKVFEREAQTNRTIEALLTGARMAWQSQRAEEARNWVDRGIGVSRSLGDQANLGQFLSLAATLANLRSEYEKAADYLKEAEQLERGSTERISGEEIAPGGTLVVALANAVVASGPASIRTLEEAEAWSTVCETLTTYGFEGNLVPLLSEKWEVRDQGQAFLFPLRRGIRFHDGEPLTAADVKRAFERSMREGDENLAAAFTSIQGVAEFLDGKADDVAGIIVHSDLQLEIKLDEPTPIYPALLADPIAGVYRMHNTGRHALPVGTGPFRAAAHSNERFRLERNADYWTESPANVDVLGFQHGLSANAIAAGLESGEIDVAGDLQPADLERFLTDARFRRGLVEKSKATTCFILFTTHAGAAAKKPEVRRALSGVVRTDDLVWKTLGRFAQPAVGLIPPGMPAHDPGKRRTLLSVDEARAMLRAAGAPEALRLRAAVNPVIQDRHAALLKALFDAWRELGVEVSIDTPDLASFMEAGKSGENYDVGILRWNADYNDPDSFTHYLFHSGSGHFRTYYCSPEMDEILSAARRETAPGTRENLYRKFENHVLQSGILVPLFHDVNYRLCSPQVRGVRLRSTYPQVNYGELWKSETKHQFTPAARDEGATIEVPMKLPVLHLDPTLAEAAEEAEVLSTIYEPLMRVREGRIEPLLAADLKIEDGGRRYRFRLRDDVRFHDGRKLSARDVRFSFERLLRTNVTGMSFALIRGGQEILDGKRNELTGFQIHSATEFTIELTSPASSFPVLLSNHVSGAIPEGTTRVGNSLDDGAVGTGPYQVNRFEPGRRLELVRNPYYWREGYPRNRGLVFTFGVPPEEIHEGFRAGRYALASDLAPQDLEALRRERTFAAGYSEAPFLSTYFVLFNRHRGPFAEVSERRRLADAVDAATLVRRTLGRRAIPAHSFIPPGLLGYESAPPSSPPRPVPQGDLTVANELMAGVHPIFDAEYAGFYEDLDAVFRAAGARIRKKTSDMGDYVEAWRTGELDLMIGRWIADYPDSDTFALFMHSRGDQAGKYTGSAALDAIIAKGQTELDPRARHAIYREVEATIRDEALLIPLFHEKIYRFARPEIEGLSVSFAMPVVAYEDLRVRR
jgi:ABC-type transport system substrate-binding protein/tRNA A-37 threonylcarbamoyl transferase component Bud32